ncbi:MAG TPA: signal peptidase I [Bacillota bacterium]|nr:signal peptidase I [Bacillota bacterium]
MEVTKKGTRAWKIVGNVVFWVLIVVVVFYSVVALFSKKEENMTSFFGLTALTVKSDSMKTTFNKGDLIFITTDFDSENLNPGDVVTYLVTTTVNGETETYYNTHRISRIDGVFIYTQGDNPELSEDPYYITSNDVIGMYTGVHLLGMGTFIDFLKSSTGFFLFIVLPCLAFLVYEIFRFVKVYSQYQVQKSMNDRVQMQEEALAAARAQLEQEQKEKADKKVPGENDKE